MWTSVFGSIGEGYLAFGMAGVVFIYALTGLIFRQVEERFWKSEQSPAIVTAYAGLMSVVIMLGRETLLSRLPWFVFMWGVPCILARWLENRRGLVQIGFAFVGVLFLGIGFLGLVVLMRLL
jgi:hypothetical protein